MSEAEEIVAFLTAALDEDQRHADAMGHYDPDEGGFYACPAARPDGYDYGDLPSGEAHCDCGLAGRKGRALREVAAKRRRMERHRPADFPTVIFGGESYLQCRGCGRPWLCPDLRDDLAVYAGRDGWRPEWGMEETR